MIARNTIAALTLLTLAAGCAGVKPPPGQSAVILEVSAEPRKKDSAKIVAGAYASDNVAVTGQMELIDYDTLDNIVVWLTSLDHNSGAGTKPPLEIDVATPSDQIRAATVGQTIVFRNAGVKSIPVYSVSDGNLFDLGQLPAGKSGNYTTLSPGLIEVLSDPAKVPVALVYVVPGTSWVAVTAARKEVVFNGVLPGNYAAQSWHPHLPGWEVRLTTQANTVTRASVGVGVKALKDVQVP